MMYVKTDRYRDRKNKQQLLAPSGVDRREKDMMYVIAAAEKNRVAINEETLRRRYHNESEDVSHEPYSQL